MLLNNAPVTAEYDFEGDVVIDLRLCLKQVFAFFVVCLFVCFLGQHLWKIFE